jgi:murein DD-endopeptidase MepM/ murein hydrolase activator NlpD
MNLREAMAFAVAAILIGTPGKAFSQADSPRKGLDIKKTALIPRYPVELVCPPLTSFYASWDDVDGTKREEPHSGVDVGRLGDDILAPAPGVVIAVWKANWGWGEEGALLIRHSREDVGLATGPKFYFSEFDHLRYDEIRVLREGVRIERGTPLGTVFRPGGKSRYLPEVHWEVWQVEDEDATRWSSNEFGARYWTNKTAHLVDPLYMLSLNGVGSEDGSVDIPVFAGDTSYDGFRGFTYIFSCREKRP